MENNMKTYYGFENANRQQDSAWFHTEAAARRFADACGWTGMEIETCDNPLPGDVMDRAGKPWEKNPAAVALGKLAKGHKKNVSKRESAARRDRLANARKRRWVKPN